MAACKTIALTKSSTTNSSQIESNGIFAKCS